MYTKPDLTPLSCTHPCGSPPELPPWTSSAHVRGSRDRKTLAGRRVLHAWGCPDLDVNMMARLLIFFEDLRLYLK